MWVYDKMKQDRPPTRERNWMSKLTGWARANTNNGDFVADQRSWVLLVANAAAIALMLGLLIFQSTIRAEPYNTATLVALYLILGGSIISLLALRFVSYMVAAHIAVGMAMAGIWFLNAWYAGETEIKTETVYLVVVSGLPALLLGRVWTAIYGAGTLMVVFYITSVLGRQGELGTRAVMDFLADTSIAVLFIVFLTFIISDIYSRALERVRRLLERQQRQNIELVQMAALVEQSEAQKRQFYRDTIYSITDGKLSICDHGELRPLTASAQVEFDVPDAESVSRARQEVRRYGEDQGLGGERLESFIIAAGEAITNMVKHAEGGRVYAGRTDDSIWVACEDHGPGIESLTLPRAVLLRGFSTKPSLGLGYSVILETADRVLLKTDETGTIVVIFRRIHPESRELSAEHLPDTWQASSSGQ